MPLYDYECLNCDKLFELRQSFHAEPVGQCPDCGKTAKRKFHPVPVIYKGSGFYTTDYARTSGETSSEVISEPKKNTQSDKEPSGKSTSKVVEES